MENEKQFLHRSRILLGAFFVFLLIFAGILYDAQVVNYETYLARSTTQVTTTRTVESSRGIVTDRNGKVLVSNQEIYTLGFDPDTVTAAEGESHDLAVSRALLRLINLCREQGVVWSDTLPISSEIFYTVATTSETSRLRFQSYLKRRIIYHKIH